MLTVGYREALVLTLDGDTTRSYSKGRRITDSKIAKVEVQQTPHWVDYRLTLENGNVIEATHAGPYQIWWKTSQTTPTKLPWIPLETGILPPPDPKEPDVSISVLVKGFYRDCWKAAYYHYRRADWSDSVTDVPIPAPTHFLEVTL